MKSNDQRVKITKLIIRNAFTKLLRQKPIQNISIKELCETAQINRGTFYNHYSDIYDLLEDIENEMLEEFRLQLEPISKSSEEIFISPEFFVNIFKFLGSHSDMCTVMFSEYGDKKFIAKMLDLGKSGCVNAYSKHFKNATSNQIDDFYSFVSAGCISLLMKWVGNGMKQSYSEIAETVEKLISCTIKFLE